MNHLPIAIDKNLLAEIEKAGERDELDVNQIIQEALYAWLKRESLSREGLRFEQEWIASLKKNPYDPRTTPRSGWKRKLG